MYSKYFSAQKYKQLFVVHYKLDELYWLIVNNIFIRPLSQCICIVVYCWVSDV